MKKRPARGEVWLINLDPTVGSEIQKTRPCVVISPPEINAHLSVLLVAPLTSGSRPAPFRVETVFKGKPGRMLLEQIRAVSTDRFVKNIGELNSETLKQSLTILRDLFED